MKHDEKRRESKVWEPTKVVREKSSSVLFPRIMHAPRGPGFQENADCFSLFVHHPPRPSYPVNSPRFLRTDSFLVSDISFPFPCLPESILLDSLLHWPEHTHSPLWSLINISLDPVDIYHHPKHPHLSIFPSCLERHTPPTLHKRWYRSTLRFVKHNDVKVRPISGVWEIVRSVSSIGRVFDACNTDNCFYSRRITDFFRGTANEKRKKKESLQRYLNELRIIHYARLSEWTTGPGRINDRISGDGEVCTLRWKRRTKAREGLSHGGDRF